MAIKKIVLDVENTTTKLTEKYTDYSPYNPSNKLVSIGWMLMEDNKLSPVNYVFIHHKELDKLGITNEDLAEELAELKQALNEADTIIAHNAKYDISWLEEAGFDCSKHSIEDTMIREYIMARGRGDISFKLADTCKRYGVSEKGEIFQQYPDLQIDEMPIDEVEEYGRQDIQACAELYLAQEERLSQESYKPLAETIKMSHEFCRSLIDIERAGVMIDKEELDRVEKEFTAEADKLKFDLTLMIKNVMGDTQVNLESPQQLSEVIYSRRIIDGREQDWTCVFNIGKDERGKHLRRPKMEYREYASHVKKLTQHILKTEVHKCETCDGVGQKTKIKIDGTPYRRSFKCSKCKGTGAVYTEINEVAGFKMKPTNINFTTVSGFSTSQTFLDEMLEQAKENDKQEAAEFIEKYMRLSSLSSYLNNFIYSIKSYTQCNDILHTNFNQTITATGRLSSTKPNLQNMPREGTFPIRKVFKSRFKDGKIIEVDFAQLEFRAAVHLSKCYNGKKDIDGKVDIHKSTQEIITKAGQPIIRQEAKSRTFKPLFGGITGTEAERTYYKAFLKTLYPGIGAWQDRLADEAISKKIITIETGRQFIFPDAERTSWGSVTRKTQIVNYPVQSFATADLLPCSLIRLHKEMKKLNLQSCIVLTVHDSVSVDAHPDEIDIVIELMKKVGLFGEEELKVRYNIDPFVHFDVEVKMGNNGMELKKVA